MIKQWIYNTENSCPEGKLTESLHIRIQSLSALDISGGEKKVPKFRFSNLKTISIIWSRDVSSLQQLQLLQQTRQRFIM